MKDATGELSMTAVAVIAIGAISVVFSTFVWPGIKATIMRSTRCANSFGCTNNCTGEQGGCLETCYYCEDGNVDCGEPQEVKCQPDA